MKKSKISLRVLVAVMSLSVVSGVFAHKTNSGSKKSLEKPKLFHGSRSSAEKPKTEKLGKDLVLYGTKNSMVVTHHGKKILSMTRTPGGGTKIKIAAKDLKAAEQALQILKGSNPRHVELRVPMGMLPEMDGFAGKDSSGRLIYYNDDAALMLSALASSSSRKGLDAFILPNSWPHQHNEKMWIEVVDARGIEDKPIPGPYPRSDFPEAEYNKIQEK